MGAMEKTINMKMDAEPEAFSQISPAYTLGHDSLDEGPSGLKRFRDSLKMQSHQILGRHRHDEKSYKRWCYDTPGLVNPKQVRCLIKPSFVFCQQAVPVFFADYKFAESA